MFDIGFSELLLFGVIALVVLGPEKLPQAARTAGKWYAKLRRTVVTLQAEIEAELDLAETRQKMQEELAKIKQAEVEMKREMAELRGSMKEFEKAQQQSLSDTSVNQVPAPSEPSNESNLVAPIIDASNLSDVETSSHQAAFNSADVTAKAMTVLAADAKNQTTALDAPALTRPWEHMWFQLGNYDKSRRLPPAPLRANYHADALLYNTPSSAESSVPSNSSTHLRKESDLLDDEETIR
ncbi:MAG: Sec-independent protein translocase protein TatB [Psychrobacter sp.]|nr:Sec-independent protein translocase protein TatB [Psychrobacter sp.]